MAQRAWRLLTEGASEMRLNRTLRNGQTFTWMRLPANIPNSPPFFANPSHSPLDSPPPPLSHKIEVAYVGVLNREPVVVAETHNACYYYTLPSNYPASGCLDCATERYFQTNTRHQCSESQNISASTLTVKLENTESKTKIPPSPPSAHLGMSLSRLYALWAYRDYYTHCRAASLAGVRILKQPVRECTVEFICSANNHLHRITALVQKIMREWGQELGMFVLVRGENAGRIIEGIKHAYSGGNCDREKSGSPASESGIEESILMLGQAHVRHTSGEGHDVWGRHVVNGVVIPDGAENTGKQTKKKGSVQEMVKSEVGLEDGREEWQWIWAPARIPESSENSGEASRDVYYPWLPTPGENVITLPVYTFPENKELANFREDVMRNLGFGYRAKYLEVSGKMMSDEDWESTIYSQGEEEWKKALSELTTEPSGKKSKKSRNQAKSQFPCDAETILKAQSLLSSIKAESDASSSTSDGLKTETETQTSTSSASSSTSTSTTTTTNPRLSSALTSTTTSPAASYTDTISLTHALPPPLAHWRQRVLGEAHAHSLMQLPGVGRKVADCIRLFSLGDADAIPVDTHVLTTALGVHSTAIAWAMARTVVERERELTASTRVDQSSMMDIKTESVKTENGETALYPNMPYVVDIAKEILKKSSTSGQVVGSVVGARKKPVDEDSDATEEEIVVPQKKRKGIKKDEKIAVPEFLPEIYHGLWRALTRLYGNVWRHASYYVPSLQDLHPLNVDTSHPVNIEPAENGSFLIPSGVISYPYVPRTIQELATGEAHGVPCPVATIAEAKEVGASVVYEGINEFYRELWGDKCGWAHSVLFTGELSVHKDEGVGQSK